MDAEFGIGRKQNRKLQEEEQQEPLVDLTDPELQNAMQIFANMSPEEMEEAMQELQAMFGDDPDATAAIEEVMQEIPKMKSANDVQASLQDLIREDEIAVATSDALKLLQQDGSWDTIWERRDDILEAVLASGQIDPADAARFRASKDDWEAELVHIWNELQKQAGAAEQQEL